MPDASDRQEAGGQEAPAGPQNCHLVGVAYTVSQMSYGLARLRVKGLIRRRPGANTDDPDLRRQKSGDLYTKVHDHLLGP